MGGGAYFFLSRFYRGAGHSGMAAAWVIIGGEREARKKLLTMLEKSKVKKKFRKKKIIKFLAVLYRTVKTLDWWL